MSTNGRWQNNETNGGEVAREVRRWEAATGRKAGAL